MNSEQVLDQVWHYIGQYILGSDVAVGLFVWFLLFGFATALRLEFGVGLILLLPVTGVLMAYGQIPLAFGGTVVLLSAIILAFSWWQNR